AKRFWRGLREVCKNITVVVRAEVLRARGAALSRGMSWDLAIEEISAEMATGLSSLDLALNARTIVTFGVSGAAVFATGKLGRFVYDPKFVEGVWERNQGGSSLLTELAVTAAAARHEADKAGSPLFIALGDALNFASAWHADATPPADRLPALVGKAKE